VEANKEQALYLLSALGPRYCITRQCLVSLGLPTKLNGNLGTLSTFVLSVGQLSSVTKSVLSGVWLGPCLTVVVPLSPRPLGSWTSTPMSGTLVRLAGGLVMSSATTKPTGHAVLPDHGSSTLEPLACDSSLRIVALVAL